MCVCVCVGMYMCEWVTNSCLTLATPWTMPHQTPLSMEFSRKEYWSGLPFPPPGNLIDPGIKPEFSVSPALEGGYFTTETLLVVSQLLSPARLFATPWTAALQASLSFTISQILLKLMSIELVMPSNHLVLCHPLLQPSIFPSMPRISRVFSNTTVQKHKF